MTMLTPAQEAAIEAKREDDVAFTKDLAKSIRRQARLKKWLPTNKWWLATIAAAATLVGMLWTGDGINTDEERLVLVGLMTQRLLAYVGRN